MKVFDGLEAVNPPLTQSVLAIGNFDGVHRAHQQLLAQAGLFAANTGGPVVALTFEPHPLSIVAPENAPERLSTRDQKLRYLARAGVEIAVVARSDSALLNLEAEEFVDQIVREKFHPTHIVEGPSFGFGRARRGTAELLRELAGGFGCEVHIVEPVTLQIEEGETLLVSSSMIRRLVADQKVRRAGLCLGRRYELEGTVVAGERRGRELGFPTVNLATSGRLLPGDGVYAGLAVMMGAAHPCAISIGTTPTFGEAERKVEAYLLDFTGELYGETIRLEFVVCLRDQKKFDSADALCEQLVRDVTAVRKALNVPVPGDRNGDVSVS